MSVYKACQKGDIAAVELFIQEGNNVDLNNILRESSLFGQVKLVEVLLDKYDADIHYDEDYAFYIACGKGNIPFMEFLMARGVDFNNHNGKALLSAAHWGHFHVVKYLVEKGIFLHYDNDAPFRFSCTTGTYETAEYLLQHGADVHADNDWAVRNTAKFSSRNDILQLLVRFGANVHANNDEALNNAKKWNAQNNYDYLLTL